MRVCAICKCRCSTLALRFAGKPRASDNLHSLNRTKLTRRSSTLAQHTVEQCAKAYAGVLIEGGMITFITKSIEDTIDHIILYNFDCKHPQNTTVIKVNIYIVRFSKL